MSSLHVDSHISISSSIGRHFDEILLHETRETNRLTFCIIVCLVVACTMMRSRATCKCGQTWSTSIVASNKRPRRRRLARGSGHWHDNQQTRQPTLVNTQLSPFELKFASLSLVVDYPLQKCESLKVVFTPTATYSNHFIEQRCCWHLLKSASSLSSRRLLD